MSAPTVDRWDLPHWTADIITDAQLTLSRRQRWLKIITAKGIPLSATETHVALTLAVFMGANDAACRVSLSRLAEASKLNRVTITRALRGLEHYAFLFVESGAKRRKVNSYRAGLPQEDPRGDRTVHRREQSPLLDGRELGAESNQSLGAESNQSEGSLGAQGTRLGAQGTHVVAESTLSSCTEQQEVDLEVALEETKEDASGVSAFRHEGQEPPGSPKCPEGCGMDLGWCRCKFKSAGQEAVAGGRR